MKNTFTCPSLILIIKENIKGKAGQDVYFKQTRRAFLLCLILHLGNFTSSLPSKVAENSFTVARGYNSKTKACNLTYLQKKTYRKNKVIQLDQLTRLFLDICEVGKDMELLLLKETVCQLEKKLWEKKKEIEKEQLDWSHSGLTSPPGEQGFKGKEQEVRPRGLASSKDNEFSLQDKTFTEAEVVNILYR